MKILATSKNRYRATATQRRLYGGSTVTEFYCYRAADSGDPSKWVVITGFGPTPGERKTDAIARYLRLYPEAAHEWTGAVTTWGVT